MAKMKLKGKGPHCKSCKMLLTDVLEELGAKEISIDLNEEKKIASCVFTYSGDKNDAIKAIEEEGYKAQ